MPIGFLRELNLQVYGDGQGNIVFEQWLDDDCKFLISTVKVSAERWQAIMEFHADDLLEEAQYKNEVQS